MLRRRLFRFVPVLIMAITASGCMPLVTITSSQSPAGVQNEPVVRTEPATAPDTPADAGLRPIAVSNVTIDVGVGSPIPVDAFVSGEWPDLCAQLAQVTQRIEDRSFDVTLLATAADPACPPDFLGLPFRIAIPINVVELPEGEYTVTVNGVTAAFTVPVIPLDDQQPQDDSDASSAGRPEGEATVPAPATAATPPESQGTSVAHYQGPNPYRASPSFDVAYDPTVWEFVEDDGSGRQDQLKHRSLPGCTIWLRAGPVGGTETATVWLAERAWTISQVQSNAIQYTAPQDDVAWVFGVLLPEAYSGMGNSTCQDAAERVLDTFRVLP